LLAARCVDFFGHRKLADRIAWVHVNLPDWQRL
jgi:hypothetical protein